MLCVVHNEHRACCASCSVLAVHNACRMQCAPCTVRFAHGAHCAQRVCVVRGLCRVLCRACLAYCVSCVMNIHLCAARVVIHTCTMHPVGTGHREKPAQRVARSASHAEESFRTQCAKSPSEFRACSKERRCGDSRADSAFTLGSPVCGAQDFELKRNW